MDGKQVGVAAAQNCDSIGAVGHMCVGVNLDEDFGGGMIDFKVFRKALSRNEIVNEVTSAGPDTKSAVAVATATPVPVTAPPQAAVAGVGGDGRMTLVEKLRELHTCRDRGLLDEQEFQSARAVVLESMAGMLKP